MISYQRTLESIQSPETGFQDGKTRNHSNDSDLFGITGKTCEECNLSMTGEDKRAKVHRKCRRAYDKRVRLAKKQAKEQERLTRKQRRAAELIAMARGILAARPWLEKNLLIAVRKAKKEGVQFRARGYFESCRNNPAFHIKNTAIPPIVKIMEEKYPDIQGVFTHPKRRDHEKQATY